MKISIPENLACNLFAAAAVIAAATACSAYSGCFDTTPRFDVEKYRRHQERVRTGIPLDEALRRLGVEDPVDITTPLDR